MVCYLTDLTSAEDVAAAKEAGVVAFKLYPAGVGRAHPLLKGSVVLFFDPGCVQGGRRAGLQAQSLAGDGMLGGSRACYLLFRQLYLAHRGT